MKRTILHSNNQQGQITFPGILVILFALTSSLNAVSKMHWSLLHLKARSKVYQCHRLVGEEIGHYVKFIGRTNQLIRALSLAPPTPATIEQTMAMKKALQLGQKLRSLGLLAKLRQSEDCSWSNTSLIIARSPYLKMQRHPVDGTLVLEHQNWSYLIKARSHGTGFMHQDFILGLRGEFLIKNRFGDFNRGKLNEFFI